MERYFTFKYYYEITGLIIGTVVLGFMVLLMIIAAVSDAWEKRQKKKVKSTERSMKMAIKIIWPNSRMCDFDSKTKGDECEGKNL